MNVWGELLRAQVENLAADPAATLPGRIFNNTVANRLKYADGSAIREIVSTDQSQTLTNKTLTSPTVNGGTVNNATVITVDNLSFDGNHITSTDTNGNIEITPNGTGNVNINKDVNINNDLAFQITDDTATGANATLTDPAGVIIRLTDGSLTSIDMIPPGVQGQLITLINATGNTITINDNTGANASYRILTGQKAAITLKDEASLILEYDNTEQRWMIIGGTGSGSGSSANYITNSDAEAGTSGYATYNDNTGVPANDVNPVDATGGTASITFTDSSSSPLFGIKSFLLSKGATNRQGDGVAYAYTLSAGDATQVLTLTLPYSTTPNYVDGDIRVGIYDATNAQIIEGTQRDLAANANGVYISSFQMPSNSTSFRVFWHISSTNALAYDVKFDQVSLEKKPVVKGPIVTDWISWTPTFTNFTVGDGVADFHYRRVGDSLEIRGEFILGTTSAVTGAIRLNMPTGFTIDGGRIADDKALIGNVLFKDADTPANTVLGRTGVTVSSNRVQLNTMASSTSSTVPFTWAANDTINVENIVVPIRGWSSNVVLSEDTGNRVVAASLYLTADQNILSASSTKVLLDAIEHDTTGSVSTGSNNWTAPESGYYHISASLLTNDMSAGDAMAMEIHRNGTSIKTARCPVALVNNNQTYHASFDYYLAKGDVIAMNANSSGDTSYRAMGGAGNTWMSIHKIQTPQSIGQGEVVGAMYVSDTGADTANDNQVLVNATKKFDTHNAYNTTTGDFTCPQSGKYLVGATVRSQAVATGSTDLVWGIDVQKNASTYTKLGANSTQASATVSLYASGSAPVDCVKGDTLRVIFNENISASVSLSATAASCNCYFIKVG